METHPDRIAAQNGFVCCPRDGVGNEAAGGGNGGNSAADYGEFLAVQGAYDLLCGYLQQRQSAVEECVGRSAGRDDDVTVRTWRRSEDSDRAAGRNGGCRADRAEESRSSRTASYTSRSNGEKSRKSYRDAERSSRASVRTIPIIVSPPNGKLADIDRLYEGEMPLRLLRFGHFLYYSGLTNWRTISRVLAWQRESRPRLGEISLRMGLCSPRQVEWILRNRSTTCPFGQTALRFGIVNSRQLDLALQRQRMLQPRFGEVLVDRRLVGAGRLRVLLHHFATHNEWVGESC